MHPAKFDYYRADSVDQTLKLMAQHGGAKFLAGGHSLLPAMKLRLAEPEVLIDIGRIPDLNRIGPLRDGGSLIGALTTHATIAADSGLPTALSEAAGQIGDPMVRNRGTIGGNVAHADPASDLPTVLLALAASFTMVGPKGSRTVTAGEFFLDLFTTALQADEILTEVRIPGTIMRSGRSGSAYAKLVNPASRYAMVGAAVDLSVDDAGACTHAGVAVGGLTSRARQATAVETALRGKQLTEETIRTAAAAVDHDLGDDVMGDIHAGAGYRRAMAPVYVRKAVEMALSRATR